MRALFGRKIPTLDELKELTDQALKEGKVGRIITVDEEVVLSDKDFTSFASDLLADQPWINREATCIRVINEDTKETVLIDPQGYQYPRYTSLEIKD
jgi:hypothetical protein